MNARWAAIALVLSAGCEEVVDPPPPPAHPCLATWGDDGDRLHVDGSAAAGGDGSSATPFTTLAEGLAAARAGGPRTIVVATGEYVGGLLLTQDDPSRSDGGLVLRGCGSSTEIVAPDGLPAVEIAGPNTADVVLRDLTLSGGRRGLAIHNGAGRDGPIVVDTVHVSDSSRVGVLIDGLVTRVRFTDVTVDGVVADGGALGWGIAVQSGGSSLAQVPAPSVFEGVDVTGATEVGLLADGAWLEVTASSVVGTSPAAGGALGRGLQLQRHTIGVLDSVIAQGNADAAVFAHKPGLDDDALRIVGSTLGTTAVGDTPGAPGTSDGLTATAGDPAPTLGSMLLVVEDTTFEANDRVHLLADGVRLRIGPNNIFGDGSDFPFAAQAGADVQGLDGGAPPVEPQELGAGEALSVFRAPVDPDEAADLVR